ncbi:MAG TPA: hypothetical protein VMV10_27490 [Pirellulales bacterium]|nr:hypothetical protein [Pirellulales bacterium]
MLGDLKSKKLIVAKGLLFGFCLLLSAAALWFRNPSLVTALLLAALVWSSARLYYFLFYVLQTYVDPSLKYAGLRAMLRQLLKRR